MTKLQLTAEYYGAAARTDYYGPRTEWTLQSVHDSDEEARQAAERINPDWDKDVQAYRLAHNQASATRGVVLALIPVDTDGYGNIWDSLPGEVQDSLADNGWEIETPDQVTVALWDGLGMWTIIDDETQQLYLCWEVEE